MTLTKIDQDAKRHLQQEVRGKLPFLIEFGNEEDIIAYAKAWNPNISPEQLKRVIKLFLDAKRERASSR